MQQARRFVNALSPLPETAAVIAATVVAVKLADRLNLSSNLSKDIQQGVSLLWFAAASIMITQRALHRYREH